MPSRVRLRCRCDCAVIAPTRLRLEAIAQCTRPLAPWVWISLWKYWVQAVDVLCIALKPDGDPFVMARLQVFLLQNSDYPARRQGSQNLPRTRKNLRQASATDIIAQSVIDEAVIFLK